MSKTASGPMTEPRRSRPRMPSGYGVPSSEEGMLPWSWARERLEQAPLYWVATTRPDGRPHLMPIWGAWVDDRFWFEGGPDTRRGRNLETNAAVSVSVERGDDVVIVEGEARAVPDPDGALSARVAAGFAKYRASHNYEPDPASWQGGGLYEVRPRTVFAWSKFPRDTTRWHLE